MQFLNVIVGCVYISHFPLKGSVLYLLHIPHTLKIQAIIYETNLMNISDENCSVSYWSTSGSGFVCYHS